MQVHSLTDPSTRAIALEIVEHGTVQDPVVTFQT